MAKNQKKPSVLSMGGVVARKHTPGNLQRLASTKLLDIKPTSHIKVPKNPLPSKEKHTKRTPHTWSLKVIFSLVVSAFIAGLYLFDISKFPPLIPGTIESIKSSSDIDSITYLPIKTALLIINKLHASDYNVRYLSVVIMLFSIFCFYKFLSSWVSRRMSFLATLLFACSSWALFQTREGNINIALVALLPAVLYLGSLIVNSTSRPLKIGAAVLLGMFVFVPGAVWFLLFPALVSIYLKDRISFKPLFLPLAAFLLVVIGYLVLALEWSLGSYHQLLKLLGLESGNFPGLSLVKTNILDLPAQLFYSGLNDSSAWLKTTPIIDWVSAVFLLAGLIYLYKAKLRPVKKKIILIFFIISLLLIFLNGFIYISLILPLIYIAVGLGLTYLTDQWMSIFPNNPVARGLGIVLVSLVILIACVFNLERYFIGWPNSEEYHQIYKG